METVFDQDIYEIRFSIESSEPEIRDFAGVVIPRSFYDERIIYSLDIPPIALKKLEEKFAPNKVQILSYYKKIFLP